MKYLLLIICTIFILSSCSPGNVTLQPIPEQQRTFIKINPFEDLTGQYKYLNPSMDSLISLTSSLPIIDVIDDDVRLRDEGDQVAYQNPIRLLRTYNVGKAKYQVNGEVELISYGPVSNLDKRISAYSFFGLLGLALSRNNDLAAYLQYRIFIKDSNDNLLESFIVSGISSDNPNSKSRKQLMFEANLIAAYSLQSRLIQFYIKNGLVAESQTIAHFRKQEVFNHALEYMLSLLNPNTSQQNK